MGCGRWDVNDGDISPNGLATLQISLSYLIHLETGIKLKTRLKVVTSHHRLHPSLRFDSQTGCCIYHGWRSHAAHTADGFAEFCEAMKKQLRKRCQYPDYAQQHRHQHNGLTCAGGRIPSSALRRINSRSIGHRG